MVPRAEPVILFYVHSLPNTMEPQSRAVTPMLYDANNQSFNIPRPLQDFQHLKITWKILAKSPKVPRSVGVRGTQESLKKSVVLIPRLQQKHIHRRGKIKIKKKQAQ